MFNPAHVQIWSGLYQQERTNRWGHLAGGGLFFAAARWGKRRWPHAMLGLARRPWGKPVFGFRLLGDHIAHFELEGFLDELHAQGTRFVHLVRRDTFDQAVSLVRARVTGVWKHRPGEATPAPELDYLALADRVAAAAEELHAHKLTSATAARRHGALLVDYDAYMADERSYDRIQEFLGARVRVPLGHANLKSPPVDEAIYRRLRQELSGRGVPLRFDLDAASQATPSGAR